MLAPIVAIFLLSLPFAQATAFAQTPISNPATNERSSKDQASFEAMIATISQSLSNPANGSLGYAAFQNGAMIEPGIYDAGGLTLPAGNGSTAVRLVARIPGTVIIRIPPGQYFLTVEGQTNAVQIDGLTFVGGKGAFRFTHQGNNVNLIQSFTRNVFINYTECAISNAANDHPYLRVRDNVFMGAGGAHTIGIAWGGYLDQGVIEDNAFLQNAYHVKLGPRLSSTMLVRHNDFINWGGPINRTKADVWILPNISDPHGVNSGLGFTITENKFGNENQSLDAPRILIANEDPATGPDRATRQPAKDDHGYVSELLITNNMFNGGGTITAPILRSYIGELRNVDWRGNKFGGSPHTAILEWANPRQSSYTNGNSSFEFTPADVIAGGIPARRFSNAVFAQLRDYGGFFPGDPNALDLWPASDSPGIALLANGLPAAARHAFGPVQISLGTRNLSLLTLSEGRSEQGLYLPFGTSALAKGGSIFFDVTLQQAPSHTLQMVVVEIRNAVDGGLAYHRVVPLPEMAGNLRAPVYLPPSRAPEAWQLRVYGSGPVVAKQTDSFQTGDWIVNSGNARLGRDRITTKAVHR